MRIVRQKDAVFGKKAGGTEAVYRLFDEYEVNTGLLPPGTIEPWHRHSEVLEAILVIEGEIEISWIEGEQIKKEILYPDDFAEKGRSVHRIANRSGSPAHIVVVKLVPDGTSKRETLKTDKQITVVNGSEEP